MQNSDERVKCRFCEWTTLKVDPIKDKGDKDWSTRLRYHIAVAHQSESREINTQLRTQHPYRRRTWYSPKST